MQKQLGLSLVELMISITLGLVLMVGVVQMFMSTKVTFNSQQSISRIQEAGRLAIEFMSKDLRAAGNYGCGKVDSAGAANSAKALQNNNLNLGGLHTNFNVGIRGYDSKTDLPNQPTYATDLGVANVAANQNIIAIRSALDVGLPVTKMNESTKVFTYTSQAAVVNNCVEGICINDAVVVGDCYGARAFRVSDLSINATELTITHTDAWDMSIIPQQFKTGEVAPLKTVVYFIADGANGFPSLWQRTNVENAVELLEGVEQMRIRYALSTSPQTYSTATAIAANWPSVASVRLELVVRSLNNNAVDAPQPYTYGGTKVTPTDRYMRQVFSTTINVRNRNL
jgi:type IV pilus assembly protein PilW